MAYNTAVEGFRDVEYPMMKGKIYLDHGGTTIYSKSLIEQFSAKLLCNLYGNPHSDSDPAQLSGLAVEKTRAEALAFFRADPEHFDLIFTANATAAIKLVGDSFQDLAMTSGAGSFFYGYHRDAHTSLVGIRELTNETHHCFMNDGEVEDWIDGIGVSRVPCQAGLPGLFAYPGQSNMTGRRLPLQWTKELRQSTKTHHQNTYSLLDAAALATTTQIDLSDPDAAPDFTAVSFYKIFGFPDLGALIVRKKSGHILSWRRFFGGGTINMLTVSQNSYVQRKDASLHEALEDGTLPFHNIIALGCALEVHKKLYSSMKSISKHTSYLAQRLYTGLSTLRHGNGHPVCTIYTDSNDMPYQDPTRQGATVAFSVLREDGSYVGHTLVEKLANTEGIYVRSGGLCNAGGIAHYLQIEPWQFKRAWSSGFRCGSDDNSAEVINGKPTGVVRASLGAMSTRSDVDMFIEFISSTFITKVQLPTVIECIGFDMPQEVAKVEDQGFPSTGDRLHRSDSGFHSHSGASAVSLNPVMLMPAVISAPKRVSSMSNVRLEEQRARLKTFQSEESLRAGNARRRAARLVLPIVVQQALDGPHEQLTKNVPRRVQSFENNRVQRRFRKNSLFKSSVHTNGISEITVLEDDEGKQHKFDRFKFWKKKPVTAAEEALCNVPCMKL